MKSYKLLLLSLLMTSLIIQPSLSSLSAHSSLTSENTISSFGAIRQTLTRLHTEGKYIKNEAGETAFLRGVSISDLLYMNHFNGGSSFPINARINDVISLVGWQKITAIECYISLSWSGSDFTSVVSAVDELKNACVADNIYFVIKADNNGDPTPYVNSLGGNATVLANWFLYWVNRYADVPNFAGIDVFNEPCSGGSQSLWRTTLQAVYNAVYSADPTLLVLCPSYGAWSIDPSLISNPIGTQAVPTFDDYWKHVGGDVRNAYASGNYTLGKQIMELMFGAGGRDSLGNVIGGFNAIQTTVPTFMNEFGWGDLNYDNSYAASHGWAILTLAQDLQACDDWYYVLNEHGIHWSVYQLWDNPNGNNGICNPGYVSLTYWGQIWAQYLTGLP